MENSSLNTIGGYAEHFIDELKDEYKCPVCLLVLFEPVQTECGHRICKLCSEEIRKRNKGVFICPLDKSISETFPDKAFERVILQLKVKCNNFEKTCQWTGELKLINKHLDSCDYQEVKCVNEQCSASLLRKELNDHIETSCIYRVVYCQYCNQKINYIGLQFHLDNCKYFPVDCLNQCGIKILREQMTSHIADDCALTLVPCQYLNIGCNFKGTRVEQDVHFNLSTHNHLEMSMLKLTFLEKLFLKSNEEAAVRIENKVTNIENKVTKIEITTLNHLEMSTIKLDFLEKRFLKSNEEAATRIENKVTHIENKVTNIENKVTSIENKVTNIENKMTNIENKVANFENKMTSLENNVRSIKKIVKNIEHEI